MNKHNSFLQACRIFWGGIFMLVLSSCINEIKDADTGAEEGKIPITFTAKVQKTDIKASGNSFETGDKISLYAMLDGDGLADDRYIDNLCLTCGEEDELLSERAVFYPLDGTPLDFVAFYPYREDGVPDGSSVLPISVQTDQSDTEKRLASDFMTASATGVESSEDAVELPFRHRLVRLKINLAPGKDESAEDMRKADPRIAATGFYTQAEYDLEDNTIGNLSERADILAGGTWKVADGQLTGKEIIVLPQAIDGNQSFQMEWDGRVYTFPLSGLEQIEEGMQYELVVNASASANQVLSGVVASITEWESGEDLGAVENTDVSAAVHLSVLSFEASNVYRVHLGGKEVAEICKEYLLSDGLASTAITAYPLTGEKEPDLSKGIVLQLLDEDEPIHGGAISWDETENTFEYTEGNLPPVQQLYFDQKGKFYTEKPAEGAAEVNIIAHTLCDVRDPSDIQEYAIVKVGTQYWMRENLKAKCYADGSKITLRNNLEGEPGYHYEKSYNLYFYNGESLLAGHEISPDGWKLPAVEDWERLSDYVGGDASLLKDGEWRLPAGEDYEDCELMPATNQTMLNIRASGLWTENGHRNEYKTVGFWSWDEATDTIPEETCFFASYSNELIFQSTVSTNGDYYKGLIVRCLKK